MKSLVYISFTTLLMLCNLAIAKSSIQTIHIADMPLWKGEAKGLRWLTSPKAHDIFGAEETHLNNIPTSRQGVIDSPAIIHNTLWINYPNLDLSAYTLPDGWKVNIKGEGCLQTKFSLYKKEDTGDTWIVEKDRTKGFFERRLGCIGGSATVYYGVLLNTRYFAFATAEPGWIFFDRQTGKFLPFVLQTNPNHLSNLYVTSDGHILVDAYFGEFSAITSTNIDRKADGIREVVFSGTRLIAPLNEVERKEILQLNKKLTCQIDQYYGRTCNQ